MVPWSELASAVLLMFLSGQETGNAAADVLMGVVGPSGRLPVTLLMNETDTIQPCQDVICEYKEKLQGGWHVYENKPSVIFPFGHGLSYTKFEYAVVENWSGPRSDGSWTITPSVRNVGSTSGIEVIQLYVSFPDEEDEPIKLLRGFHKTPLLAPGEVHTTKLTLAKRDLSVWDVSQHAWRLATGKFNAYIGASSQDHRLCGSFGEDNEPMHICTTLDNVALGYSSM